MYELRFKISILAALLITSISASTFASGGVKGGGGIKRNGQYLTFGSANVRVFPVDNSIKDVPGLALLQRSVTTFPITTELKGKFLEAIAPFGDRKYFFIDEKELGKKQRQELLKKYQTALDTPISLKDLVVYLITVDKETFILPEFFKVQDPEKKVPQEILQAALLFHEALWVFAPDLKKTENYKFVIDAEIKFQHHLQLPPDSFDPDFIAVLDTLFKTPRGKSLVFSEGLKSDIKNGYMAGFVRPNTSIVKLGDLWGAGHFNVDEYAVNLLRLISIYPNSCTLKYLYENKAQAYTELWWPVRLQDYSEVHLKDSQGNVVLHSYSTSTAVCDPEQEYDLSNRRGTISCSSDPMMGCPPRSHFLIYGQGGGAIYFDDLTAGQIYGNIRSWLYNRGGSRNDACEEF